MITDLKKLPNKLKKTVEDYMEKYKNSEILGIQITEGLTPYKDKSITQNLYIVAIEEGNLCTSMSYRTCSNPKWNYDEVIVSSMIYAEILNIVNNNTYLKNEVKNNICGGDNL